VKYDLLWENISELPYFRGFLRAIEGRFLRNYEFDEPILDLGCGDGHFSARTFPNSHMYGVDPSHKTIRFAKNYNFFDGLVCAQGGTLPFNSGFFGSVISNSVLEHIQDVDEVLEESYRILKAQGRLFITVPNSNFTEQLSVAKFFDRIKLDGLAIAYRSWFNKISRHHHADPTVQWQERLKSAKFEIIESFEYFPPAFLKVLEWGHYFGLPFWINRQVTGRWVLYNSKNNLWLKTVENCLRKYYESDPLSKSGAYSLIIARK
jgi:SAM-dependent methyltransferase